MVGEVRGQPQISVNEEQTGNRDQNTICDVMWSAQAKMASRIVFLNVGLKRRIYYLRRILIKTSLLDSARRGTPSQMAWSILYVKPEVGLM